MKNPLSLSEDELRETPEDSLVATTETDTDDVKDFTTYLKVEKNYFKIAAIPGNTLPSSISSIAPPPVET